MATEPSVGIGRPLRHQATNQLIVLTELHPDVGAFDLNAMNHLYALILFLVASSLALAQTGQISGATAPFASLSLLKTRLGSQANASGAFTILAIPAGDYQLRVSAVGFSPTTASVTVRASGTTSVDITLTPSAAYLEEIVVTASRKPENVKEVPSAMTIVGQRQIQEQAAMNTDITNILQYTVPGLAVSTGRTSNTGQTLRGRQVLVLIDGVPQSTPLRNGGRDLRIVDPSAIERIEVIKGATSIYGNGADGGIINYITKKPSTTLAFSAQTWAGLTGQVGHTNQTVGYRLSQQFTGRINRLDYLVNGTIERTGLQRDATGAPIAAFYNTGHMNTYNALAKVGYTLTDHQRIEGMYNYYGTKSDLQYVDQIGVYGKTPTIGVPATGELPGTPQGTPYNHNATLRYSYDRLLGGTSAEVIGYLQSFRTVYGYDTQFFENGGQSNVVSNKKGVRLNLNTPFALGKSLAGEWVYGLDLLNDQTAQKLQDGRFWTPDMSMTNAAPFAQLKLDFWQNLTLKAGARYENIGVVVSDFTTLKTYNATTTTNYDGGVAVQGGTLNYKAFVGNMGLRYSGWNAFQPFVSFSQSFSINELGRILRTSQKAIVSQLETKPIIVDNYEVGVSGQIGRLVHYDLSAYESRSELGASYKTLASGVFEIVRAPERIRGYEAAIDITPVRFLAVGGSYTYLEGKADSNNDGDYESYLGSDRIGAPKTTVYVRIQPTKQLNLNVNALRSGNRNQYSPAANGSYAYAQGPVTAYTLLNVSGSYQLTPKMGLSLGVENLLNTDYYPAISQWSARAADYIKGIGRRGLLTVNYRW